MENTFDGFKFEEIITTEEKAIMYAVANNTHINPKEINPQLDLARRLKNN
jgi:hypothetical protein